MKKVSKEILKEASHKLLFDMSEEEYSALEREFDVVLKQLDFIYQVDGLDDAEPMVFPYELDENSLREDIAIETLSQEDVLKNAKDEAKGMIKLPKVVR